MKALELIGKSSLDPDALKQVGEAFDHLWAVIADNFAAHEKEQARLQLARMLLDLHAAGTDLADLEAEALELLSSAKK